MVTSVASEFLITPLGWNWHEEPYRDLNDPEKSVRVDLAKGMAAGKLDVMYSLFPPEGVGQPVARYTWCGPSCKFIEVPLIITRFQSGFEGKDGLSLAFGIIDSKYLRARRIETSRHGVTVAGLKYDLKRRQGHMFFRKEMYDFLLQAW